MSSAEIESYLKTEDGQKYLADLQSASPAADKKVIFERAIAQLESGSGLPERFSVSSPLVKVVPHGEEVSSYSPFFTTNEELNSALASQKDLADYYGLPIKSEARTYDIYEITPNSTANALISEVAPTEELGGLVQRSGKAKQYIVTNRGEWSAPQFIGTTRN